MRRIQADKARFGCIILAAGSPAPTGSPAQIPEPGGGPPALRAAEAALASPAWPVVIVLGANADRVRPLLARLPVLIADNPAWSEGMASSIRAGIATLRQFSRALPGAVLALCDQPGFAADSVSRLIEAQRATGRSIAAARHGGRLGAPVLVLRSHFAALAALTGEEGVQSLIAAAGDDVAPVDMPEDLADLKA